MADTKIAKPSFVAGIEKSAIVLDAYKKDNSKIVNSIQELGSSLGVDLGGILSGNFGGIGNLIQGVSSGKFNIDKEQLLSRMLTNSDLRSTFRDISGSGALSSLGINPEMANKVFSTVNGITTKVMGADLSSAQGIAKMINSVSSGNFSAQFLDKGALAGIVTSLVKEGTGLGLPNVFSSLAQGITDKSILMNAAKSLLPESLQKGEYKILLDVAESALNGNLKSVVPKLAGTLLQNLNLPIDLKKIDYDKLYDKLTKVLDDNDSGWMNAKQGSDTTAVNASYTANNSKVTALFQAKLNQTAVSIPAPKQSTDPAEIAVQSDVKKYIIMAQAFGTTTVEACLRKDFPYVPIKVNEGISKPYIKDPFLR